MTNERKLQFRERMPVIAKMIHHAFNGDEADKREYAGFALVVRYPDGAVSMIKNLSDDEMAACFMSIMTTQAEKEERVGHA